MNIRDNFNSIENYINIIHFMKDNIKQWQEELKEVLEDEKNGIQRHPNSNAHIIEATKYDITLFQTQVLLATYSAGFSIELFKKEFFSTLAFMENSWKHRGGYLSMLDMLSIAIILDLKSEQYTLFELFKQNNEKDDFQINDFLLDFLFKQNNIDREVYPDFLIAKPYSLLKEVIILASKDKSKAVLKLKTYLQRNWFSALKRQDLIQETHKSPYGTHCGYWSFESGALVKILGLDDCILRDVPYYPYDLVHYQHS